MGWMGCVGCEKLQRDFVAQTFALITPVQYVLPQVSCSYKTITNAPKYYKMHRNIGIGSNGVDWLRSLPKIPKWLRGTNFCALVHSVLHRVSCSYKTILNASTHYETHQNMSLGSNGVDQVCSLRKITTWLPGTNFCINWTILICFATSFKQLRNDPKWTQTLWNTPKHEIRVQWGGSGAFVAKNYNVTSWHKLLN